MLGANGISYDDAIKIEKERKNEKKGCILVLFYFLFFLSVWEN